MSQDHKKTNAVTLDDAFKAFKHWRSHKAEYPSIGIPNDLWVTIFDLEDEGYSSTELKRLFALSSSQYNIKKKEFCEPVTPLPSISDDKPNTAANKTVELMSFCEVAAPPAREESIPFLTEKIKATQQSLSRLKSTDNNPKHYLDTTTIIVECIRPDGHRLKIHTTNQSLNIVMATFYQQGVAPE